MRHVKIDRDLLMLAYGRDTDFHDTCPRTTYLDVDTGSVIWIYERDQDAEDEGGFAAADNRSDKLKVEDNPERYIRIPGASHRDHHELLRAFLRSDWMDDDEELRANARTAYVRSIGAWKKKVPDEVFWAFKDFRDEKLLERAEAYLREHGVEPIWKP